MDNQRSIKINAMFTWGLWHDFVYDSYNQLKAKKVQLCLALYRVAP